MATLRIVWLPLQTVIAPVAVRGQPTIAHGANRSIKKTQKNYTLLDIYI